MSFIDAHLHVWTDDFARYPLAAGHAAAGMMRPRYTSAEFLAEARPHGIDRAVPVQMSYYGTDNRYLLDAIAAQPGVFRGVAVIDPHGPDPAAEMRRLHGAGIAGFRIYGTAGGGAGSPADLARWLDAPGYAAMFAAAAETRQAICPLLDPEALPALDRMAARFPDTPVVIDHLARLTASAPLKRRAELDALCGLARFPRVHVKVSAFYALSETGPPYDDLTALVKRVCDAFGPRRLMWGSDAPLQSMKHGYAPCAPDAAECLAFLGGEERAWVTRRAAEAVFFV